MHRFTSQHPTPHPHHHPIPPPLPLKLLTKPMFNTIHFTQSTKGSLSACISSNRLACLCHLMPQDFRTRTHCVDKQKGSARFCSFSGRLLEQRVSFRRYHRCLFFFPTQAPHHHHSLILFCFALDSPKLTYNRSLLSDTWALDRRGGFLARQWLFLLSPRDNEDQLRCVFLHLSFPLVCVSAHARDTAHKDQEAADSWN